jgi:hypothetical protein
MGHREWGSDWKVKIGSRKEEKIAEGIGHRAWGIG